MNVMNSILFLFLLLPLATGMLAWLLPWRKMGEILQGVGSFFLLLLSVWMMVAVMRKGAIIAWNEWFYVDAFTAYFIFLIALVGFTASLYSIGYMGHELETGRFTARQYHRYYLWFHLFLFAMLLTVVMNNLGFLWVGIELTTLVSALLVAFYQKGTALEAGWKYLMMGSVGIAFALLGILFLYLSGVNLLGEDPRALNWTYLMESAHRFNPRWMEMSFLLILVGFGTKAGLAPMHFWLPDAHSEAPSPISAVLSGVLLNTALYGIFRVYLIANQTLQGEAGRYLILFGLLSIAIAVPFLLVQHDLKRMLAYSSVEHMGIITLGMGIGGPVGTFGALLHMANHSMTKSLLFFAAGNMVQKYHSKRIDRIAGVLSSQPVTGGLFLLGLLAITGLPPFSIFVSEWMIMMAGFQSGYLWQTTLFLVLIGIIFAGMGFYAVKILFGDRPAKMDKGEMSPWSTYPLFLPLLFVIFFGLYLPEGVREVLQQIVHLFKGGI